MKEMVEMLCGKQSSTTSHKNSTLIHTYANADEVLQRKIEEYHLYRNKGKLHEPQRSAGSKVIIKITTPMH